MAESAQLGHGSGVVYENYLDVLRTLPKLLERYKLPAIEADDFQWPDPIVVRLRRPDRLYEEFRRLVMPARVEAFSLRKEFSMVARRRVKLNGTKVATPAKAAHLIAPGNGRFLLAILVAIVMCCLIWRRLIY